MEKILNEYYENNAKKLRVMVDKILFKLKFHNVDKEDFYSLANEVFVDVMNRYDNSQDFDGFLYSSLYRKFCTQMTRLNREKRKADKTALSLDEKINDEENSLTVGDIVGDKETVETQIFKEEREEWRKEVLEYLERLSPLQRKIAFLLSDNNTPDEICEELHITMKHFENSVKRILSDERIKPLRQLVERN